MLLMIPLTKKEASKHYQIKQFIFISSRAKKYLMKLKTLQILISSRMEQNYETRKICINILLIDSMKRFLPEMKFFQYFELFFAKKNLNELSKNIQIDFYIHSVMCVLVSGKS